MQYRIGKCSQCGQQYNIPASFAHNVARCKKCKGVVHVGPVPGGADAPAAASAGESPAAKPAAPRSAAPKPVVSRPAAPPAAAPQPAAPQAQAPRPPSAKPAAATPGIPAKRVVAKPEPARPAAPESRRGTPAPAGARPAAPGKATGTRQAESSAGARARGTRGAEASEDGGRSRRGASERRAPREKKKPPMAGILSGVALIVVAAGLYLFRDSLFGGSEAAAEVASTGQATPGTGTETPSATSAAQREAVEPEAEDAEPAAADSAAAEAEAAAAKEETPKATKHKDPASIDLAGIPDFQPTPDTSAEEWAQMKEWMETWMDRDAGAAGNRARLSLMKESRRAVPAILNYFKKLDFATPEGRGNGDLCQKTLMDICNGTNFDWKYADEAGGHPYDDPDDVWFCKRVTELWCNSWKQAEQSIEAWIKIAKLDEKDPKEAARLREMFGGQSAPPEPSSDDDLEVD